MTFDRPSDLSFRPPLPGPTTCQTTNTGGPCIHSHDGGPKKEKGDRGVVWCGVGRGSGTRMREKKEAVRPAIKGRNDVVSRTVA